MSSKTKPNVKNRNKKRKANSPIEHDSGQTGFARQEKCKQGSGQRILKGISFKDNPSKSADTSKATKSTDNKDLQTTTPEHFLFESIAMAQNLSGMYTPTPTPSPYGSQYLPSPTFQMQAGSPPLWAAEIINDVRTIKLLVSRIEIVEKTVNKIDNKVESLENKMKNIEKRMEDNEKAFDFMNKEFETNKHELMTTKNKLKEINGDLKVRNEKVEKEIDQFKTKNEILENKIDDLEYRSLRENLLFHGIQEEAQENCEGKVQELINTHLNISANITFDRVHRLGRRGAKNPRPIVAKFHQYKDRELVLTTAQQKSEELKSQNFGVSIQQTRNTLQKRRELYPIMERMRSAGNKVKWSGSRLLVSSDNSGVFREIKQ